MTLTLNSNLIDGFKEGVKFLLKKGEEKMSKDIFEAVFYIELTKGMVISMIEKDDSSEDTIKQMLLKI